MRISVYAVIDSIIIGSFLLSVICFLRKHICFKTISDVKVACIAYILCIIRLLLPIDFSFTTGISLKGTFTNVWKFLFDARFLMFNKECSVVDIVIAIVFVIAIWKLGSFLIRYNLMAHKLTALPACNSEQVEIVSDQIRSMGYDLHPEMILYSGSLHTPYTVGIFKKRIIIPAINFSDGELYYILLHELNHIRRYDLLKKFVLQLLFCILWWVPCHTWVINDIQQILEIHCDKAVIHNMTSKEICLYMETMLSCLKKISFDRTDKTILAFTLIERRKDILERFQLITASDVKLKKFPAALLAILAVVVFLTYLAVPFPYYENDYSQINSEAYLVLDNDSYYIVHPEQDFYQGIPKFYATLLIEGGMKLKGDPK